MSAVVSDHVEMMVGPAVQGEQGQFLVPAKIYKTVYDVGHKNVLGAEFISRQTNQGAHTLHTPAQSTRWWRCGCGHEVADGQLRCPLAWCRRSKRSGSDIPELRVAPWVPGLLQRVAKYGLRLTVTDGALRCEPSDGGECVELTEVLWDLMQVSDDIVDALVQGGAS